MNMFTKRYRLILPFCAAVFLLAGADAPAEKPGQGTLTIIEPDGNTSAGCPLEHTSVKAEVAGFIAQLTVTQTFHNPRKEKIEAVYTFPLSAQAAVNDMVMKVGERVVRGTIQRREEARRIYDQARQRGNVASLLDQERPNIFTQSVANIMPNEKVVITIRYAEVLPYEDGAFKFVFPMVVGPRFMPGDPVGHQGTGWSHDTTQVPDASRITPPVAPEGLRAGHDVDLSVLVDAGVPIIDIRSALHEVTINRPGEKKAAIALKNSKEIPNRDFVLTYSVAGDDVRSGVLAHKDGADGYVTLIMIPPKRVKPEQVAPREMIFVIDCSGSQRGKPLEQAKAAMRYFIDRMNPEDTFNIIDFNEGARMLFPEPKKNTAENRAKALAYLEPLEARGGTWMGPAVEAVCKNPPADNRLRIVSFMTDGYVGNDFQIISLVKQLRGQSRWFPFGTGNSVNRFLLDQMARVGGGEVEYILLNSPGEEVARKFYERIAEPVLTNISLGISGVELEEVFPESVTDLWARKPLIFKARYSKAGKGKVILKGMRGGKPYEEAIDITLPDKEPGNSAIAGIWARAKVDDLMDRDWMGMQRGTPAQGLKEEIIKVALAHRIMTQFTSFVAVEETVVTEGGKPVRITVPVEMPDGVSREGVFGGHGGVAAARPAAIPLAHQSAPAVMGKTAAKRTRNDSVQAPSSVEPEKGLRRDVPTDRMKEAKQSYEGGGGLLEQAEGKKMSVDLRQFVAMLKEKGRVRDYAQDRIRVTDGKITLQVQLASTSDDTLKKLEKAGLKILFSSSTARLVIGTIAVDKMMSLMELPEIVFLEPAQIG